MTLTLLDQELLLQRLDDVEKLGASLLLSGLEDSEQQG